MNTQNNRGFRSDLTQEKETLLLTLYARALDSRQTRPILGDYAAEALVRRLDYDFQNLAVTTSDRFATVIRARHLDRWISAFLVEHPKSTVLHLACGLDSRVNRIDPPASVRWIDLDYPEVIDLRRRLYPVREGCHMIASSVTDPGWLEDVPADNPVLVAAEGLTMYLVEDELKKLFHRVIGHFPGGQLVFDATNSLGIRVLKHKDSIRATGAACGWGIDDPRELERWHPQLELVEELCLSDSAVIDGVPWPYRLLYGAMNRVPPLRMLGRLLRFRF